MNKPQFAGLTALAGFCLLCLFSPAQAMLGEDYQMIKSYYAAPEKWPDKKALVEQFAKIRKEARPQILQFFTNKEGKISKEYWSVMGGAWSLQEANTIRSGIMKGRNPVGGWPTGSGGVAYLYADGSLVIYQLGMGGVFSILARDGSYDPGDFGRMPQAYWDMIKIYRPAGY